MLAQHLQRLSRLILERLKLCLCEIVWVDHWVDHFSAYIYQKRGFYYFPRHVPKLLQNSHSKQRIVLALNTRSRAKALKHAQVICQRLDERRLPIRLDAMGLNNVFANDMRTLPHPSYL